MQYDICTESGITLINLDGEIDVSHAPRLRETLTQLIESDCQKLLINLTDVVYLDSAGLSVLIATHRRAQGAGVVVGLIGPQQPIRQVFNITGVDKVIPIFPTKAEGIAEFRVKD